MLRSMWNHRLFLAVLLSFVFVFAIQMSEPAAAAKWKKFDAGHEIHYDTNAKMQYIVSWKAYKKGNNYVMVKFTTYWVNYPSKKYYSTKYYKKISKYKMKTICGDTKRVYYHKTKLNAVRFYYRQSRLY